MRRTLQIAALTTCNLSLKGSDPNQSELGRLGGKPIPRHPCRPARSLSLRQQRLSKPQAHRLPGVLFCGTVCLSFGGPQEISQPWPFSHNSRWQAIGRRRPVYISGGRTLSGSTKNQRSRQQSLGQLVKQCPGLLQIKRVEAFGEPAVDRSEKLASLIPLPLVAPEPRHAMAAQLRGLRYRRRALDRTFHCLRLES
jgi:hypothetical protein